MFLVYMVLGSLKMMIMMIMVGLGRKKIGMCEYETRKEKALWSLGQRKCFDVLDYNYSCSAYLSILSIYTFYYYAVSFFAFQSRPMTI